MSILSDLTMAPHSKACICPMILKLYSCYYLKDAHGLQNGPQKFVLHAAIGVRLSGRLL